MNSQHIKLPFKSKLTNKKSLRKCSIFVCVFQLQKQSMYTIWDVLRHVFLETHLCCCCKNALSTEPFIIRFNHAGINIWCVTQLMITCMKNDQSVIKTEN